MSQGIEPGTIDIPFSVPFVHRLRFTDDVLGNEQDILLDVLEASGDQLPRVQFWLDECVADAVPELRSRVDQFCHAHADRFLTPGNIQTVPGGEIVKNEIHILERMLKCINHADLDRRSYVVVIGGGAVLDAVGFAAAIAHRGIRLVRLPTTTLAQADSGVGVKNSVNLFQKKNWLGSFAVPWAVINDAKLLSTLPVRDYVCGFSEAVKVALLKEPELFDDLCRNRFRDSESQRHNHRTNYSPFRSPPSESHHKRWRPIRSPRSTAAGLRALVGAQARSDDKLWSASRRSRWDRRGGRHCLLITRAWAARSRR